MTRMKRRSLTILLSLTLLVPTLFAQHPQPTQQEIDKWNSDRNAQVLETSPCKRITWLLDQEAELLRASSPMNRPPLHDALGWWGRGFIEGVLSMVSGDQAQAAKKVADFGTSRDVVAAHIAAYCVDHPTETPTRAVADLLHKMLK